MGSEVVAKCQCGVEAAILIGGGMSNFMTTCFFPCLCESCHRIVQVNLLDKPLKCSECGAGNPIPYDDPRLSDSPGHHRVAEWGMGEQPARKLILTDGKYKCPNCGTMGLEFSDSGLCWD